MEPNKVKYKDAPVCYNEGVQAYYDGLNASDNPYDASTHEFAFKTWRMGLEDTCH